MQSNITILTDTLLSEAGAWQGAIARESFPLRIECDLLGSQTAAITGRLGPDTVSFTATVAPAPPEAAGQKPWAYALKLSSASGLVSFLGAGMAGLAYARAVGGAIDWDSDGTLSTEFDQARDTMLTMYRTLTEPPPQPGPGTAKGVVTMSGTIRRVWPEKP